MPTRRVFCNGPEAACPGKLCESNGECGGCNTLITDQVSSQGLIPAWYYYPIIWPRYLTWSLVTLEQIIDNVGIPIMINITVSQGSLHNQRFQATAAGPKIVPTRKLCTTFFSQISRIVFLICVHTSECSQAAPALGAGVNSRQEVKCLQINMSPLHDKPPALPDTLRYRQIGLELRPVQ